MTRSKWLLVLSIAPAVIASVAGVKIEGIVSSLVGGWALICWVLAFILRKKKNAPAGAKHLHDSTQNAPAAAPRAADPQPAKPSYKFISFRVAGVTFANDDGTQRQKILRAIKFNDPPYVTEPNNLEINIKSTEYDGQQAFACLVNGYQIGFVPKDRIGDVAEAMEHDDVTVTGFRVTGGGKSSDGEQLSYGCEMGIRYTPALQKF